MVIAAHGRTALYKALAKSRVAGKLAKNALKAAYNGAVKAWQRVAERITWAKEKSQDFYLAAHRLMEKTGNGDEEHRRKMQKQLVKLGVKLIKTGWDVLVKVIDKN